VLCRLLGVHQPGNAVLAAAAARQLGADEAAIRRGMATVDWPGRFQIVARDPLVILDGAHNPGGARVLARSLATYFPAQRVTFVIGISADKDQRGILQALEGMAIDHPIVVRLDGTNAEEGRRLLSEAAPPNLHVEPTMLDAARRAVELAA